MNTPFESFYKNETSQEHLERDEQHARFEERRYQRELWLERAARHEDYVAGLEEGWIAASEIAVAGMTVEEAIEVERRNVAYCLKQMNLFDEEA